MVLRTLQLLALATMHVVLHYIENNQQVKAGEVILMDVGAEYF